MDEALSPTSQYPTVPATSARMMSALNCNSTIYGLKQSPRAYYLLWKKVYTEIEITQLKTDE